MNARDSHSFRDDGPCVWCGQKMEDVLDRRGPRECPERPYWADEREQALPDARTGY